MDRLHATSWAAAALLCACAGSPPAPEAPAAPEAPPAAEATAAPEAPPAPPTFEPAAPPGWTVEQVELGDRRLVLALADAPAEGATTPPGRLSLLEGDRVVDQRPIDAMLDVPEGESWFPLIGTVDAGERTLVRVSVRGVTGEDYKEIVDQSALLAADPPSLEPLWRGSGGTTYGMMGRCIIDTRLVVAATGDVLTLTPTPEARWLGGPPEEDWERDIEKECAAGAAPTPIVVRLPPRP